MMTRKTSSSGGGSRSVVRRTSSYPSNKSQGAIPRQKKWSPPGLRYMRLNNVMITMLCVTAFTSIVDAASKSRVIANSVQPKTVTIRRDQWENKESSGFQVMDQDMPEGNGFFGSGPTMVNIRKGGPADRALGSKPHLYEGSRILKVNATEIYSVTDYTNLMAALRATGKHKCFKITVVPPDTFTFELKRDGNGSAGFGLARTFNKHIPHIGTTTDKCPSLQGYEGCQIIAVNGKAVNNKEQYSKLAVREPNVRFKITVMPPASRLTKFTITSDEKGKDGIVLSAWTSKSIIQDVVRNGPAHNAGLSTAYKDSQIIKMDNQAVCPTQIYENFKKPKQTFKITVLTSVTKRDITRKSRKEVLGEMEGRIGGINIKLAEKNAEDAFEPFEIRAALMLMFKIKRWKPDLLRYDTTTLRTAVNFVRYMYSEVLEKRWHKEMEKRWDGGRIVRELKLHRKEDAIDKMINAVASELNYTKEQVESIIHPIEVGKSYTKKINNDRVKIKGVVQDTTTNSSGKAREITFTYMNSYGRTWTLTRKDLKRNNEIVLVLYEGSKKERKKLLSKLRTRYGKPETTKTIELLHAIRRVASVHRRKEGLLRTGFQSKWEAQQKAARDAKAAFLETHGVPEDETENPEIPFHKYLRSLLNKHEAQIIKIVETLPGLRQRRRLQSLAARLDYCERTMALK